MTDVIRDHIEIVEGSGGPKARIKGHRVRVVDIVNMHTDLAWSPMSTLRWRTTSTIATR